MKGRVSSAKPIVPPPSAKTKSRSASASGPRPPLARTSAASAASIAPVAWRTPKAPPIRKM